MISLAYIQQHLLGLTEMLRGRDGTEMMDLTEEGVFRSFWAVILSMPFTVVTDVFANQALTLHPDYEKFDIPDYPFAYAAVVQMLTLFASWGLLLVLLVGLAQQVHAGRRITPMIVAFNWSVLFLQPFNLLIFFAVAALGVYELIQIALLFLVGFWFYVRWSTLRFALQIPVLLNIGIVALLFFASSLLADVAGALSRQFFEAFLAPTTNMSVL